MTDNEIAICKEIICDLNTYCALTPATYKPMGFEFQENDFICLNNLIELINRQKAEIERNREIIEYLEIVISALEKSLESEKTEAIKEFGKFLIDKSRHGMILTADIPEYVKEMTEGENG